MLELRRTFSGTVRVKLASESGGEELGWSTAVTASGESLMSFLERMSSDEARSAVADAAEVVTADYESALTRFYECFEDFLDGERSSTCLRGERLKPGQRCCCQTTRSMPSAHLSWSQHAAT